MTVRKAVDVHQLAIELHTSGKVIVFLCHTLCKKASNHHANLPLEMYSFTL